METGTGDAGLTGRPTLASSWDAAPGALTRRLLLLRAGAQDVDWEELLAPPAPGQDLVSLKRNPDTRGDNACFLFLRCDPKGGEAVLSIGIVSSARNMEVYAGEEYCGTSRGQNVCSALESSEHEKVVLYRKYLKLESSTHICKIKLLSFGEKQCVFISKVMVHMRPVSADSPPRVPALGSRIDLDKVQTIMESMGSKLSPGAQQLMNMVRFQQQSCVPIREQLQSLLGTTGHKHLVAPQSSPSGALDTSSSTPFPFRTGLTSANVTANLQASPGQSAQPPGGGNAPNGDKCKTVPQSPSLPGNDLKNAVSSFLPKEPSDSSHPPSSEMLPFLQSLCGQVNHLRLGHHAKWQENLSKPREGLGGVAMNEQPICSYLEKVLSKNLELMEKKLTDYIDQRMYKLQEHVDEKIALVMDLLQNPNSPPAGLPLRHYDSGERLSNGER